MWLNCHLRANQDSPEVKSLYYHETQKMSAEYNLYRYIYRCTKTSPCKNKNAFGSRVRWRSGKLKPCCCFCDINELEIIIVKVKTAPRAIYNLLNGSMKILRVDLHQIERGLRIISKTRPRATQESSEEIDRRFHFVSSSETFQHLCGFSRRPFGEPPKHFPLNNTLSTENYT